MNGFTHRFIAPVFLIIGISYSSAHETGTTGGYDILNIEKFLPHEVSLIGISPVNTFLFFIPPLAWNIVFSRQLPMAYFPAQAPVWLVITENIFRYSTMAYSALLPINTHHDLFVPGAMVYASGMAAYIASWLVLMVLPDSSPAQNVFMRFGPMLLPLVWLGGMSMMARSPLLMIFSTAFIGFHCAEYAVRYRP